MLTDLGISKDCKDIQADYQWYQFGYGGNKKVIRPKTVYEAKVEICRKLEDYDVPAYKTGDVKVELTHNNMGDIAKLIEEYKDIAFKQFDKALTVWMRQGKYGGVDHRGLWDRLTSAPLVSVTFSRIQSSSLMSCRVREDGRF
jgi:hypothetical protein